MTIGYDRMTWLTENGAVQQEERVTTLADRAFDASAFDFGQLLVTPGMLLSRADRHGVRLAVGLTEALPDAALDALLAWRLGQYLLTGFYDPDVVEAEGMIREDRDGVHHGDIHAIAFDADGAISTYITLKQPEAQNPTNQYRDRHRPLFPCEEVHGRDWQRNISGVDDLPMAACWEVARFVTDQRREFGDPVRHRGPLELALAAARLATHPNYRDSIRFVTGDLDPEVALRNLRFFFVPVATFPPHEVHLPAGHPLAPRYRDHQTAPFAATARDVDWAAYIRWTDINMALDCDDEELLQRFLALRQFVSVKESSLKRPLVPSSDSPYPLESLVSAASLDASAALWRSAQRGELDWEARVLGPGEPLPRDQVVWVVDGFGQARSRAAGHIAGIGPEVAFVPDPLYVDHIETLEAVTPMRALVTGLEGFEDYWRTRQGLFETSTERLYGIDVLHES